MKKILPLLFLVAACADEPESKEDPRPDHVQVYIHDTDVDGGAVEKYRPDCPNGMVINFENGVPWNEFAWTVTGAEMWNDYFRGWSQLPLTYGSTVAVGAPVANCSLVVRYRPAEWTRAIQYFLPSGKPIKCEFIFGTVNPSFAELVAQHEIGHCMGLPHDYYDNSIMHGSNLGEWVYQHHIEYIVNNWIFYWY